MNFVEKGVKIFILTTLSITFRGAAELYCIQFTFFLVPDEPVASTSSNTRKREKKKQKTPRDGPKKARYCSAFKNPMKGHKNIKDCPKNKKQSQKFKSHSEYCLC